MVCKSARVRRVAAPVWLARNTASAWPRAAQRMSHHKAELSAYQHRQRICCVRNSWFVAVGVWTCSHFSKRLVRPSANNPISMDRGRRGLSLLLGRGG